MKLAIVGTRNPEISYERFCEIVQKYPVSKIISGGRKGFVEAAKRYEERDGYRFTSYAAWWVRQNIMLTIAYKKKML